MQKTSRSSSRSSSRSVRWVFAIGTLAALSSAVACRSEVLGPDGDNGGLTGTKTAGRGGSAGKGASAGVSNNAGHGGTTGGATSVGGSASGSGGTVMAMGGTGTGGTIVSGGGMSAGGGMAGAGGTVISTGGTGGTGGSGGTGGGGGMGTGGMSGMSSGGMGGKPCVDVEPPPDPDWPDATCYNWANETSECSAEWFATYCDVSCKRCVPDSSGGAGAPAVDCSTMGLPQVSGGTGFATRYWDCCQPHCSQFDGHRCGQDGVSSTGDQNSACTGGGSFACYDEAPHAVNDCLSYGFIAKANPNCGGCYRIQFTGDGQYNASDQGSRAIKGKQMIVKVSNTGGDVASNQFDLMVPGGGVGQNNACTREWGTSDLGAQYGGFLTNCSGTYEAKKDCVRQNCMKIPAGKARDGCIWFIDWFQIADNPKFVSQATDCPF